MIDDLNFFNQATLRICSSLDMNEVAHECLKYIRQYIPLEGVMMNYYDEKKRSLVFLAAASEIPLNLPKTSVPVSDEIHHLFKVAKYKVSIFNDMGKDPGVLAVWKSLTDIEKSSIVLFTYLKGQRFGQVDFFIRGRNRYSKEDAHLIELLQKPFSIAMANSLQYQDIVNIKDLFSNNIRQLRDELRQATNAVIIGDSEGLRSVINEVLQVAPLKTPVLLLGETGVGKEVIANRIHYSSPRLDGPFLKINCGAFPESLLDSELFGHEKGAFTGALSQKPGIFERAHQGTIFLDEVGDLPGSVQVRLLRVLQEKEIVRVGGTKPIKTDVRIIAATHRNMDLLLQNGSFRQDLWFRLGVFPITIPPLRERKSDIPLLVQYFIMKKSKELNLRANPELAPGTMESLIAYDWPGNVRELQNIVERALIRMRIKNPSLPLSFDEFIPTANTSKRILTKPGNQFLSIDEVTKQHIQEALEIAQGRIQGINGAAELLQINPSTLRHRMRLLGIPYGRQKKNGTSKIKK